MGRPWGKEDDALLRRAVAEGATYAEVAAELGRGYHAVKDRGRALGISRRCGRVPDVGRRVRLLGLLSAGLTLSAAARAMGLSQPGVAQRMAARMVADGLLVRLGTRTSGVRYVPAGVRRAA